MRADFIEITAFIRQDRERTIAIWDGTCDEQGSEVWTWLPKSQIELAGRGRQVTIKVPAWLARKEGLESAADGLRTQVARLTSRVNELETRLAQVEQHAGSAPTRH